MVRGGQLSAGRGQVRGRGAVNLNMTARASPLPRGVMAGPGRSIIQSPGLRGVQPGNGRGLRRPGRPPVRPQVCAPAPAPAPLSTPLPEALTNLRGLSVTRQKPVKVSLPEGLRLPAGITISHPRGISNHTPTSPPHYNTPPSPPDTEKKQKVSLELTAQQMETEESWFTVIK